MLSMAILNKENLKEGVESLFSFDMDFVGENGPEYTSEAAKKNGFSSDIDYCIDKFIPADLENTDIEQIVRNIIGEFNKINKNYYKTVEHEFIKVEDGVVVALSCYSYN